MAADPGCPENLITVSGTGEVMTEPDIGLVTLGVGRLLALRYQDADATRCQGEAQRLARWLGQEIRRLKSPIELIGPAPCFFGRVAGRFRWQIVLRAADPAVLIREVVLPPGWRIDVDPASLL